MTLTYVTRLAPYHITKSGSPVDRYVYKWMEERMPEVLDLLMDYTRGMYSLDLHYKAFFKFDHNDVVPTQYSSAAMLEARTTVEECLRESFSVKAISASTLDKVKYIGSSAAGYGYLGNKRDNYYLARARATANLANFRKFGSEFRFTPYRAFARTQLALRSDPKVRHVWGAPFHTILIEGLIAQPIIENVTKNDGPIYIGSHIMKDLPEDVFSLLQLDNYAYCLDFSAFDSSVPAILIEWFFEFVGNCVSFPNNFTRSALEYVKCELIRTPVVMPDGRLYICTGGIPSGSYFTQLLGSYVNLLILTYAQICIFGKPTKTFVLGDDSIFCHTDGSKLRRFIDVLKEIGFTVNVKKTVVSHNLQEITFLGHQFYGTKLTRNDFNLLCLALHTEEENNDIVKTIDRLCSLFYDGGCDSFLIYRMILELCSRYQLEYPSYAGPPPFSGLYLLC